MQHLCGWRKDESEVRRIWETMPTPFFSAPAPEQKNQFNHVIFKDMNGFDAPNGPQKIGDCVSWGNGNAVNYTETLEAYLQIQKQLVNGEFPSFEEALGQYEYEEVCTEAIYALSRVEIGGQKGSYTDGSVGAWAAKALTTYGAFSRKDLEAHGKPGAYDGNRAKAWGASGLTPDLENLAREHPVADMTPVNSFNDAAWHLQNFRVVAVCSDVGFENGSGSSITVRDSKGFVKPRGSWGHCMLFVSVQMGSRPGCLILNQWGDTAVSGPMGDVEIPKCSWWVDADVVDRMLKQGDSFTPTKYKGYPARQLTWKF